MNNFISRGRNAVAACLALLALAACAQNTKEAEVKQRIEVRLGEGFKVDEVRKTEYMGLYEVRRGNDILYTDEEVKYVFVGNVFDAATRQNLTKSRLEEVNKIGFADLPLDKALKTVKGDGSRAIAIFSDPNCGYCKQFEKTLKGVDNITVYTFMYNILSPDSDIKARNVWCSADRNKTWREWMTEGKVPPAVAECPTPNKDVFELGRKLNVSGTPTIFFKDGSRISGAVDAKGLEDKLATVK